MKPLLQSCQRAGIRFIYPARQRPQHRNLKATQAWLHNNYVEVPELPEESPDFYPVLGFVAGIQILSPNASAALIELYVQMNREREGGRGGEAHMFQMCKPLRRIHCLMQKVPLLHVDFWIVQPVVCFS